LKELDEVERALQLARTELSAPEAALERVWQRVGPGAVAATKPSGWAALRATGASGVAAAAVIASGGFALGYMARAEAPAAPAVVATTTTVVTPAAAPAPTAIAQSERSESVVADASVEVAPRPSARAPAARATKPASDGAQQELALLQRVERALRNEDGALALVLLRELDRKFPKSALLEERAAARLMGHCVQKERAAPEAARAFLKQHPSSVYQSRLRSLCKLGTSAGDDGLTGTPAPDTDGP
jgi:hypothetical protein